ncbi:hypothetical protein [Christiangramia salexigens]|uniref:Uncharacterized protein n=1 Tax=Christiangramia salexigens TaxID=1913577 RepID=A0A1L3J292_9FLAO|nr:hypothetical protein [Christiangramia salexigens]APG59236.1 hypothetical protein LPB144_01905 [Christiangramia salexigens]
MKIKFFFLFLIACSGLSAQEYWDRKDFEIGNRGIENSWREFGFSWQTESEFNLPDGSFLHLNNEIQKKQIDMLAVISRDQKNKIQRKVDLGSPLSGKEKEKKVFEIKAETRLRDQNDIFANPFYSNDIFNRNNNGYGLGRYNSSSYRIYY